MAAFPTEFRFVCTDIEDKYCELQMVSYPLKKNVHNFISTLCCFFYNGGSCAAAGKTKEEQR
jgi:hypothetical protein